MSVLKWTKAILWSILFAAFFLNAADVLVDDGPQQGFWQWVNHPTYHLRSNSLVRFPFTIYWVLFDDASRQIYHDWPELIQDRQAFSKAFGNQMAIVWIATIICAALCFLPVVLSSLLLVGQRKGRVLGKFGKWIQLALGVLCSFIGLAALLIWGGGLGTLVIGLGGVGLVYASRVERTASLASNLSLAAASVGDAASPGSAGHNWRARLKSRVPFTAEEWMAARGEVDARDASLAKDIRSGRDGSPDVTPRES